MMKRPIECVIDFAKHPRESGQEFKFALDGDEAFALRYVQRMRVEIARIRKKLRDRSFTIQLFKMIFVSAKFNPTTKQTDVILHKLFADEVAEATIEQFASLITGRRIGK